MFDYDIDCEKCENDFFQLIDFFIKDIHRLELKVIRLRYLLSGFLPEHEGNMLRIEIFSNLSGRYYDNPAYEQYMERWYSGSDPMDCAEMVELMKKVSKGEEIVDI